MVEGNNIDSLRVNTLPFNGMDIAFDKYIEISEIYNEGISEKELAEEINKAAKETLEEANGRRCTKSSA